MSEQIKLTPNQESARNVAVAILPEQLENSWPILDKILRDVESWTQCLSADDIKTGLMSGKMQLWGLLDDYDFGTLAVSQIANSPRGSICTIWLIATQLRLGDATLSVAEAAPMANLIAGIQRFAIHFGCYALEINVHPLWANKLAGKVTAVIIERDLRTPKPIADGESNGHKLYLS